MLYSSYYRLLSIVVYHQLKGNWSAIYYLLLLSWWGLYSGKKPAYLKNQKFFKLLQSKNSFFGFSAAPVVGSLQWQIMTYSKLLLVI